MITAHDHVPPPQALQQEARIQQKIVDQRARCLLQQRDLAEQVVLPRENTREIHARRTRDTREMKAR